MDVRSKVATFVFVILAISSLVRAIMLQGHVAKLLGGLALWVIGLMLFTLLLAWVSRRFVARKSSPRLIAFVSRKKKTAPRRKAA